MIYYFIFISLYWDCELMSSKSGKQEPGFPRWKIIDPIGVYDLSSLVPTACLIGFLSNQLFHPSTRLATRRRELGKKVGWVNGINFSPTSVVLSMILSLRCSRQTSVAQCVTLTSVNPKTASCCLFNRNILIRTIIRRLLFPVLCIPLAGSILKLIRNWFKAFDP